MSEAKICPYPGLRPFTESESIFFRGRDAHIKQIKEQLEERKFLMLTGASGDGKSSVVYAGVIPEARAGFFKANFNNWVIASFKPERSPLNNLASSLSTQLKIDQGEVETELSFGFSAIINLYKSSEYYLNQSGDEWINADEEAKRKLKSKAANLFILVDQFEEFFTNTENYSKGKPSKQSQITVNLILETAKIALAEDLPIYIICTMRSDYIGHCAAFKGLPEYIGYSQFFVPRLNRKEVYQIIEEPAELGGTSVAHRVIEVLINELSDGFDQLPVLQHALNNLWNVADKGEKEIDLIHLAMVGGIAPHLLPEEDLKQFNSWKDNLPEFKAQYYENPSISNILAAHADELYEEDHATEAISQEEAQHVIKVSFQCLTKIDTDRAVRNRMSLGEITKIINRPKLNTEAVASVLRVFREQGNTFISPFVSEDVEKSTLTEDSVLEITHESLIRNWDLLNQWAEDEHHNWLNFQDFSKQLQRWVDSGRSDGYLLPIGPLTFFEGWYKKKKPNKYWLTRYDERDIPLDQKLEESEAILTDARDFIKQSARKLFFSRSVIKYGANRIITFTAIFALICTCTYYYYDYNQKLNKSVIEDLQENGITLLASRNVNIAPKAHFLINHERLNPGSFTGMLDGLNNDSLAFDIAMEMFKLTENYNTQNKIETNPLVHSLFNYLNKIVTGISVGGKIFEANSTGRGDEIGTIDEYGNVSIRKETKYIVLRNGNIVNRSGDVVGILERKDSVSQPVIEMSNGMFHQFELNGSISENNLRNLNSFISTCYFIKLHDLSFEVDLALKESLSRLYGAINHILSWESDSETYEEALLVYEKKKLVYDLEEQRWKMEFEKWKNNLRDTKPERPVYFHKPRKRNFNQDRSIVDNVSAFNQGIELLIASKEILGVDKLKELTLKLSPFESIKSQIIFNKIYPKEERWKVSNRNSHFLTHNGGYQILAYLSAVEGNLDLIDKCLDSLFKYNGDYKKYDNENFYMIFHYLTKFDYYPSFKTENLLNKYQRYSELSRLKIVEKICKRDFDTRLSSTLISGATKELHGANIIPFLISDEQKDRGWDEYGSATGKQMAEFSNLPTWMRKSFHDDINFNFAMYYKKRGISSMLGVKSSGEKGREDLTRNRSDEIFQAAFKFYAKISEDFLNQDFTIGWEDDPMSKKIKYRELFLYPGVIREDDTRNPYSIDSEVKNPLPFFNYILRNSLTIEFYKTRTDYKVVERFLYEYYDAFNLNSDQTKRRINYKYFDFAKRLIVKHNMARQSIDIDFMQMVKFIRYFDMGMIREYDTEGNRDINIPEIHDSHEFQNREEPYGRVNKELLRKLATRFALTNRFEKSMMVLNMFIDDKIKRNTLIDITYGLQRMGPIENTFDYLNMMFEDVERGEDFGLKLIKVLSMIGSQNMYDLSLKLIKDQNAQRKVRAINNLVWGVSYNGYYYKAYEFIPDYISSNDELDLYNQIIYTEIIQNIESLDQRDSKADVWKSFDKKYFHRDHWLDYEDDNRNILYGLNTLN